MDTIEAAAPPMPPDDDTGDDDVIVLPWWQNIWNIVALVLAAAVIAGTGGWVLGNNAAQPDPNAVDIGFLQDMRWHHEQAVTMSLIFLENPEASPALKALARDITVSQNIDIGRMIEWLRSFGADEAPPTDIGMAWMNEPTPLDRMPGMATDADIERLATAKGPEVDDIFVTLMTAHHEGGIHMAEYAAANGNVGAVKKFAQTIVDSQRGEIAELEQYLAGTKNP